MLRKILMVIVTIAISMSIIIGENVSAMYVPPNSIQYSYAKSCGSMLYFSGSTATCTSDVIGYYNETTKIIFSQTLQKQNSSGIWSDVNSASWTTTVYNYTGSVTNTKNSLSGGTYRLKTVFKVYAGTSYETITKYSQNCTI